MHTLRVLRRLAAVAASVLLLCVVVAGLVLNVPMLAELVVDTGLGRTPASVSVGGVSGPLRGPLVLTNLEVERDGTRLHIESVVFDWRPLSLISRAVVVDSLHVAGITGVVSPTDGATLDNGSDEPVSPEGPPTVPELPLDVQVRDLRIGIGRIEVADRGVVRSAEVAFAGSLSDFTLDVRIEGEGAPLDDVIVDASVTGRPEDYRVRATTEFVSAGLPPTTARMDAVGSLVGLSVDSARVDTEEGFASLVADLTWYPDITWTIESSADVLDVASLTPDPDAWPGRISFAARSEGQLAESGIVASAFVDDLAGTLRGDSLTGGLALEVTMPSVMLPRLELRWGDVAVNASGVVLDTADLDVAVRIPDLSQLRPGARGSVSLDGAFTGAAESPRVVGRFDVAAAGMDSLGLDRAVGSFDIDMREDMSNEFEARLDGLSAGATTVDSVRLSLTGPWNDHAIEVSAWHPEAEARLVAHGALSGIGPGTDRSPSWEGWLDALLIGAEAAGQWRLADPAGVVAAADSVRLDEACLVQGPSSACASLQRDAAGVIRASVVVADLPLSALPIDVPESVSLLGRVDAEAEAEIRADRTLRSIASIVASGTASTLAGQDTARFEFDGDGVQLVVDSTGASARVDMTLRPVPSGAPFEIVGDVLLPGLTSIDVGPSEQTLDGRLRVASEDLSFLGAFSPLVSALEGQLLVDAAMSGTLAEPEMRGAVRLTEGRVAASEIGVDVVAINLIAEANPEGGVRIEGAARSGEGALRIDGVAPLQPTPDEPARLHLSGEQFRVADTPEIQIEVAPDLDVAFDGELISVDGELAVPWARVELLEIPPVAVPPSPDVIIVDEEPVAPPEVEARVRVVVGDDVRFSGFGFTSAFGGDLDVLESPGIPPTVSGELRFIDGRYRAYGQDLVIDPGRVVFLGPVEDAVLEVVANRAAQDGTTAGLAVSGSLIAPEISLTSDPAMADADVLSYILYGKPLSDGDTSEQGQVAGAAATLGANVVTTRLASQVGLDDARIEGTTRAQAELVAGKYLSPSIYVSYGVGLFRPATTFRIKYLLNSNWALQAESGEANGGDIIYQIERGR